MTSYNLLTKYMKKGLGMQKENHDYLKNILILASAIELSRRTILMGRRDKELAGAKERTSAEISNVVFSNFNGKIREGEF